MCSSTMSNNLLVILLLAVVVPNSYGFKLTGDCLLTLSHGGKLKGNCSNKNFISFTNVRYAKPPVGDKRFEVSQLAETWKGKRDAVSAPITCTQFRKTLTGTSVSGQEDCLVVNIYRPKKQSGNKLYPVVIYLHPGAFQFGGPNNSPDVVMEQGGAIWVLVAYRLGPLGFLSTGDSRMPGNNGLKDQRLAIEWVHRYIESFGGDPNKVLLLGDSAGSASVEYHKITGTKHITAYMSLSGSVSNSWAYHEHPEKPAETLGKKLNCSIESSGDAFKNCLKNKKIEDIWSAVIAMHEYREFSIALFRPTLEPENVPGAFLTKHPEKLILSSNNTKKNYYVSIVLGEGAWMAASLMQLQASGVEVVEELNTIWNNVCPIMFMLEDESAYNQSRICQELKNTYMENELFSLASYKRLALIFGDKYFHKGIEKSMALHITAGQTVYMGVGNLPTRYNIGNELSLRNELKFESVHTSDAFSILPMHLNVPPNPPIPGRPETLRHYIEFLLSFLSDGPPTYNGTVVPGNTNNEDIPEVIYFTDNFHKIDTCPNLRKTMVANITGSLSVDV